MVKTIDEKNQVIANIINTVEKEYGKGALMQFGKKTNISANVISSGSIVLDHAIGIGGYPRGRIIEIYGPEASGKTTLALHAIAECQKINGQAVFIDVEHALNPSYAAKIGINLDQLIVGQPNAGEEALDIVETLIKTNKIDLIVVDSVAALVPRAELEGNIGDQSIGAQARLMSKALRKLRCVVHENNCLLIFINQIRSKINIMFGSPETTSGGRALKFYASLRLDVRTGEKLIHLNEIYGNRIKVKVVKNKLANPFKIAILELIYGQGIDEYGELISLAVAHNIIDKKGIWYSYNNQQLGQGRSVTRNFLIKHQPLKNEIKKAVLKVLAAQ